MKSKLIFCSLLALSIAFISCKKEEEAEEATATTSETQQPIMVPTVTPTIRTENYEQSNPQVNMPVQNGTQPGQAPVVTKAGMNPPHGQAGHRCDIAVGAPLNSPAAKPSTAAPTQGQAFTTTTIPTPNSTGKTTGTPELLKTNAPVVTAPGMNPPHGQEGHRCDIAVGEPLNK